LLIRTRVRFKKFSQKEGFIRIITFPVLMGDMDYPLQQALEKASEFYTDRGFELPKLKVEFMDYQPEGLMPLIARANTHFKLGPALFDFANSMAEKSIDSIFGEKLLPDEREVILRTMSRDFEPLKSIDAIIKTDADIVFLKKALRYKEDIGSLSQVAVHEIWHLIESKKPYFLEMPMIIEATATYAEGQYVNHKFDMPLELYPAMSDQQIKLGGANMIQAAINGSDRPLHRLLDYEFRKSVNNEFTERMMNTFVLKYKLFAEESGILEKIKSLRR
jgi:hypothetical protein